MFFTKTRKKLSNLNVCLKSDHSSNDWKTLLFGAQNFICSKSMSYLLLNDFKLNCVVFINWQVLNIVWFHILINNEITHQKSLHWGIQFHIVVSSFSIAFASMYYKNEWHCMNLIHHALKLTSCLKRNERRICLLDKKDRLL